MGLKICEKCGEEVDEAKAFCPNCGNPFVEEEKRENSTEFESSAGTVNFSKSAFNIMLSEMDLDTSTPPDKNYGGESEKPFEKPGFSKNAEIKTNQSNYKHLENTPPKSVVDLHLSTELKQNAKIRTSNNKWLIIALAAGVFLLALIVAVLLFVNISFL